MGIFDRFKKKAVDVNQNLFSFLMGTVPPDWKGNEYLRQYKGWVYACVTAIAESVADMDLELMKATPDGEVEVEHNIALDLLENVNNYTTSSMLLLGTQSYLELDGNAFWYLPSGGVTQKPAEIWLLDPTRMTVVRSSTEIVSGYIYQNEKGDKVPLTTKEVLHFKRFNPLNRYRGMGTVQASAMAIDIDNYSSEWNRNFFWNSAVPSAVLETPNEIGDEEFTRLKAKWDSYYTGIDNAHRMVILQGGLTYKPMNMSQKDMDFLEQRKFTRDEIMAMFRVPKTILGITDDVNRANAEASEYVFAKRVVKPRMQFIVDVLNEFYLPLFGIDQNQMWFEFSDPVPENVELDLQYKESGLRAGWLSPNEARAMEGLKPVENGNQVFISGLQMPLGTVIDTGSNEKTFKNVKKHTFSQSQLKEVDSRVKWIHNQIKKTKPKFATQYRKVGKDMSDALAKEAKSITKGTVDDWVRVAVKGIGSMQLYFGDVLNETHKVSLEKGAIATREKLNTADAFDLANPRALDWLGTRGLYAVTSIDDTVKEKAKEIITQGVNEGWGAIKTGKALEQFYDEKSEYMAERLARTEVVSAYAEGSLEAGLEDGNVVSKVWNAQPTACEECLMNEDDGEIPKDAGFSTGDFCPPVHPNCECVMEYITGDESPKSVTYQRAIKNAEKHIDEKAEEIKLMLDEEKDKAKAEAQKIVTDAKADAVKIIELAKEKGEEEKKELVKDLKKLKTKVLTEVYGDNE